MMRFLFAALLFLGTLEANQAQKFMKAYQTQQYEVACKYGMNLFYEGARDTNLLIAIGNACAQSDYINFLGRLQSALQLNEEARDAAVYFSSLILTKRLLFQFMFDETDITSYTLPVTNHLLSRVFEKIKEGNYKVVSRHPKVIKIGDDQKYMLLYTKKRLMIEEYRNSQIVQTHRYL